MNNKESQIPSQDSDYLLRMPHLVPLLEVSQALERRDDAALFRLGLRRDDRDAFLEQVRLCAEGWTYAVDAKQSVYAHARLWVMPIVVRPGFLSPSVNPQHETLASIHSEIAQWAGEDNETSMVYCVPSYTDINAFQPGNLRNMTQLLAQPAQGDPQQVVTIVERPVPQIPGLPRLHFLVGAFKRMVTYPEFPPYTGDAAAEHYARVDGMTALLAGNETYDVADSHRMRLPLPFSTGIAAGLKMWLEEIRASVQVKAWSVAHNQTPGRMTLTMICRRLDGSEQEFGFAVPLCQWQIGVNGVQGVLNALADVPVVDGLGSDENDVRSVKGKKGH